MKIGWRPNTITSGVWRLFWLSTISIVTCLSVSVWNLSLSSGIGASVRRATAFEAQLRQIGEDLLEAETGQRGYLLTGSEVYLKPYSNSIADLHRQSSGLKDLVVDPEVKPQLALLGIVIEAKLEELDDTVELMRRGQKADALKIIATDRGQQLMDDFHRLRKDMLTEQERFVLAGRAQYFETIAKALYGSLGVGVVAIIVLLVTTRYISSRVRRPIDALVAGIRTMAAGDLEHRVTITAKDELGHLAEAFNAMAEQALEARHARDSVQAELERSNAELDSFAYVASHDLKAPLRGIRNLTEWITEDLGWNTSAETRDNLALLLRRVDRLDGLLESLLEYSRVGRRQEAIESVDTGQLVADIAEYLAPRPGFTVICQEGMPTFKAAKPALEKILRNLIGNALKHHDRDQGTITVSAAVKGAMVEFRVADDGPGIPREFHEKVFQMFQTLKPRDQVEGSGMGLAIVKKTVEGAGGTIRVESAPPERGTVFVVTWPLTASQASS